MKSSFLFAGLLAASLLCLFVPSVNRTRYSREQMCVRAQRAGLATERSCRLNWYFDVGLNNGDSVLQLLDKTSPPPSESECSPGVWNVVGFEPNRKHSPQLRALQKALLQRADVGNTTLFLETAAGTEDGMITFYHDKLLTDGEVAATTRRDANSADASLSDLVRQVDIVNVLRGLKIAKQDYVYIKIDVEGSEFSIVRHLIGSGMIVFIDKLDIEWHDENPLVLTGSAQREAAQQHQCLSWMLKPYLAVGAWS